MSATRSLLLGTVSLSVSLLGAEIAFSGTAFGNTLPFSGITTGVHTTELNPANFGDLEFPLFNSNLGTLQSVAVSIVGLLDGTGSAVNNTAGTQSLGYDKLSKMTVTSSGINTLVTDINHLNHTGSVYTGLHVIGGSVTTSVAPHATLALGPFSTTNTGSFVISSALGQFEKVGGGSTGLNVTTFTKDQTTETGGAFTVNVATSAAFTVNVVYTYTPSAQGPAVPEPASLMLLGTGLAGLGAATRRHGWRAIKLPPWLWRRGVRFRPLD